MKKNIGKRILSLALALVLVLGLMPNFIFEAKAAPLNSVTISGLNYTITVQSATDNNGNNALSEIQAVKFYGDETRSDNQVRITNIELTNYIGFATVSFTDSDCTSSLSVTQTVQSGNDKVGYKTAVLVITRPAASHTGGICTNPKCTRCDTSYTVAHNYTTYASDGTNHWQICANNSSHTSTKVPCSGGVATCVAKATYSTCKNAYGSVDSKNHRLKYSWETTNSTTSGKWCHYKICLDCDRNANKGTCTPDREYHCSQVAWCSVCVKTRFSAPDDHDWGEWQPHRIQELHWWKPHLRHPRNLYRLRRFLS